AAHAILLKMMNDLEENKARLVGHENHHLFFDTFDRYVRQLTYITDEIHYFRNVLNQYGEAPQRLEDMMELAACGKWRLFSARYHRYEEAEADAAYHVKFISESGRFERSEEHTSELQSRENLVCRLLLEKKNQNPDVTRGSDT